MALAFYLILWVLGSLGIALPAMVIVILKVVFVLVAILILYQLFAPYFGNINWWGRGLNPRVASLLLKGTKMRVIIIGLVMALTLSACASQQAATVTTNSVAGAEIALTSAEKAALVYTSLPRCPGVALCSDPTLVTKIKSADNVAYGAVMAARSNSALVAVALTSIQNLTNLIPVSTTK